MLEGLFPTIVSCQIVCYVVPALPQFYSTCSSVVTPYFSPIDDTGMLYESQSQTVVPCSFSSHPTLSMLVSTEQSLCFYLSPASDLVRVSRDSVGAHFVSYSFLSRSVGFPDCLRVMRISHLKNNRIHDFLSEPQKGTKPRYRRFAGRPTDYARFPASDIINVLPKKNTYTHAATNPNSGLIIAAGTRER